MIASNSDTRPLLSDLRQNMVSVDVVLTSEMLGCYKPHPEFYARMLRACNLRADEMIYVGDTISSDVEGPMQAGIQAVWLNRRGESSPATGMIEIDSLEKLPAVMASIAKSRDRIK